MNGLRACALVIILFCLLPVAPPARGLIIGWVNCAHTSVTVTDEHGHSSTTTGYECDPIFGGYEAGFSDRETIGHIHNGDNGTISNPGDVAGTQRDASQKTPCDQAGNPVVFSTGNKIEPEVDFTSAGDMPLSLTRTYNYYWDGIGIFGRRWLSDYDYKLLFTTDDPTSSCYTRPGNARCDPLNHPIWAQRPDGRKIKFNYSVTPTPGWYEDKPAPVAKIVQTGSTYTLYSESHTVEVYDNYGFPSRIENQQGIGQTFSYDGNHYLTRVTHSSGRHIDFGWSDGLLTQITDPAGHVYHYSYAIIPVGNSLMAPQANSLRLGSSGVPTANMRQEDPLPVDPPPTPYNPPIKTMVALLVGVTQPGTAGSSPATHVTYQYGDARFRTALTGKTINGMRYAWFSYDDGGRAIETTHANGIERYRFAYTLDDNHAIVSTTITNPLSKQTTFHFNASGNQTVVSGAESTHCSATQKEKTYDANGYPSSATDFNGNKTSFSYAATGQLQQKVEAAGTNVERRTDYVWDPAYHRISKVTLEGSRETSYAYDAHNRLTATTVKNLSANVAESRGWARTVSRTYTIGANGLVTSMVVDGPLAGSGDARTWTYAATGDLLSATDALGHTTTYTGYNGLGQPGSITGPNGDKRSFSYDARGRIVNARTYRHGGTQDTHYEYDAFGRLARVTRPDGHTRSYQYDGAGRLTSMFEPEAGGTFAQTVYTYNAMSLPTSMKKQRVFVEPPRGTVP